MLLKDEIKIWLRMSVGATYVRWPTPWAARSCAPRGVPMASSNFGKECVNASLRVQLPIGLSFSAAMARSFVSVAFLGHLGTDYLSAASIASLWMNVTSTCLYQGICNATSGLVSQATGAKNFRLAGYWFQHALFYYTLSAMVMFVLWMQTEPILAAIGFDRSQCALAGTYAKYVASGGRVRGSHMLTSDAVCLYFVACCRVWEGGAGPSCVGRGGGVVACLFRRRWPVSVTPYRFRWQPALLCVPCRRV